jgi:hypothetical protein
MRQGLRPCPVDLIVEIHTAHPAYGAERMTRELQRQGVGVGRRVLGTTRRPAHVT